VLAALGSAIGSGLLAPNAAAQIAARRQDDELPPPLLVVPSNAPPPILLASHRSHSSHSSHSSHRSHYSSSSGSWSTPSTDSSEPVQAPPPPPPRPKPGRVTIVAFPGGQIFIDDTPAGRDATAVLTLAPGSHRVRIVNRFLGESTATIEIGDGQTGAVPIYW